MDVLEILEIRIGYIRDIRHMPLPPGIKKE